MFQYFVFSREDIAMDIILCAFLKIFPTDS